MTDRERVDVADMKMLLVERARGVCEVCGNPIGPLNVQMAHRIPQTKHNLKKYGKALIHHPLNLAATCSLECNGKVIVHGKPEEHLVQEIRDEMAQGQLF